MSKPTLRECREWLIMVHSPIQHTGIDTLRGTARIVEVQRLAEEDRAIVRAIVAQLEAGAVCAEVLKKAVVEMDGVDFGRCIAHCVEQQAQAALSQATAAGLIAKCEHTLGYARGSVANVRNAERQGHDPHPQTARAFICRAEGLAGRE